MFDASTRSLDWRAGCVPMRMRNVDAPAFVLPLFAIVNETVIASPAFADVLLSVTDVTARSGCNCAPHCVDETLMIAPLDSVEPALFVACTLYVYICPAITVVSSYERVCEPSGPLINSPSRRTVYVSAESEAVHVTCTPGDVLVTQNTDADTTGADGNPSHFTSSVMKGGFESAEPDAFTARTT